MVPSLLLLTALFVSFLILLASIAFAAYRVVAKREGPALGAPGGCALAAVLLGIGLFAMIGFIVLIGILFAHHRELRGEAVESHRAVKSEAIFELEPASTPTPAEAPKLDSNAKDDGIRKY